MFDANTSGLTVFEEVVDKIREALHFYNILSCPCAFPRFRQYAAVDCVGTGDSYALRETEAIIELSRKDFDVSSPSTNAVYTCKKCGSIYDFEWQDLSIHISRSCLKISSLLVEEVGAEPRIPIPAAAGPYGHSYPENLFEKVDPGTLYAYLIQLKQPK